MINLYQKKAEKRMMIHSLYKRRMTCVLRIFVLILFSMKVVNAQQIPITGKVTSSNGESLIGVTVTLKNSSYGAQTDQNGSFSLTAPSIEATLVFTYLGFLKKEEAIAGRSQINVVLEKDDQQLSEVIVTGFGVQKRESLTGAVATITSKDLERVHGGSTVSSGLAGKLPGVSFKMPDGRPGAGANIQIRNMGNPLYVIDGIQQDASQFNNIAPNDIESITILKDASAAIYGVRAANGVVVVTTKRGKRNTDSKISVDSYVGWQNWSRFPDVVNDSYQWMLGKADGEMNQFGSTNITSDELERYRAGTERGYQSFNWKDFIIQNNSPLSSINVNATGGSDKINYYLSATNLHQNSVLGREFTFERQNIQSNVDVQISDALKVGVQINGRIETRDNPGVPGADDYWLPRFAIMRNRPMERPYANDNPNYLNDIGHNETNWAFINKEISGYQNDKWRRLQSNFTLDYKIPGIEGLSLNGMYSYYIADNVLNGKEYVYGAYTYDPQEDTYAVTGGSINPFRRRVTEKIISNNYQARMNYDNTFGNHTFGGVLALDRQESRHTRQYIHAVPKSDLLPLVYFSNMDQYDDSDDEEARIGYIGRLNYNYARKYYIEISARRDASWKFAPDKRVGYFPSASIGWRITEEPFMKSFLGENSFVNDIKFRASYGILGDDNIDIGPYDYLAGYNYNTGITIIDGAPIVGTRDKGNPITNISWFKSKITDIGIDFTLLDNKLTGSLDYFYRLRTGLRGIKYDIVVPSEIGYSLPDENVNSDAHFGGEGALAYNGNIGDVNFSVGGNVSYARGKFISSYKPIFENSWDQYRNSSEGRYTDIFWGQQVIGQFQSQEEINNYSVNIDGQGNRTILPGDLIYKDTNGDGKIDSYDERPIGYGAGAQPSVNYGFNIYLSYKAFDFNADFSGGSMYSWNQSSEQRWPYQNEGALNELLTDRWHRADVFDLNSQWISGEYPAFRFNNGGHSNYNKESNYWLHNVSYLRARTIELGYSLPQSLIKRVNIKKARVYINGYNLFSFDNLKKFGVDPEVNEANGLQYPQNKFFNAGINLTL